MDNFSPYEPFIYIVAFSSNESSQTEYSPILYSSDISEVNTLTGPGTGPHLLDRDMVPALPALWYCRNLPKDSMDFFDMPCSIIQEKQKHSSAHNVILLPVNHLEMILKVLFRGPLSGARRMLLIGPDNKKEHLEDLAARLKFDLPATTYSDLSPSTLEQHWNQIGARINTPFPMLEQLPIRPVIDLDRAGIELPFLRLQRQLTMQDAFVSIKTTDAIANLWATHSQIATIAKLEGQGLTEVEAAAIFEEELAVQVSILRIPAVVGFPGVAPKQHKIYPSTTENVHVEEENFTSEWPKRYVGCSDSEIEASAIALIVAHEAVARDSIGTVLPECPPAAFVALAKLEKHLLGPTKPKAVNRILGELNRAMEPIWNSDAAHALKRASSLSVVSNFPIGLSSPPGSSTPFSSRVPIAYRPLTPLTRAIQHISVPDLSATFVNGFKVLIAECILPDDRIGPLSRMLWGGVAENFSTDDPRSTLVIKETLSVEALKSAIQEEKPDVLLISAHGFTNPDQNIAGIMVGHDFFMGGGLGQIPPLVILSACHVGPRGTGAVTVADILLREGALAVLSTLVPVDVKHNAAFMQRLFVYMSEVLSGREDHGTLLDVWRRVQTTHAVFDITAGNQNFQRWFMTPTKGLKAPIFRFTLEPSTVRLTGHDIYKDSERRLLEVADRTGDRDRVGSWLKSGYVPESAFYCFLGYPDRILLR